MDVKTSSISATSQISRRSLWVGASALLLAGCQTTGKRTQLDSVTSRAKAYKDNFRKDPHYLSMYAAIPEEKFPLPAVDLKHISDQRFLRQLVPFEGPEPAGTLVVDPKQRFLYVVNDDGTALRYGVGVGRAGFGWEGDAIIQYKRKWPRWTPPAEMIARQPELEKYRNGMEPGLDNALGARALYLFDNGRDTLYRLHGTNEPSSIGKNVSSGCIRLLNQDVIDLYNRVPDGTRVIVRSSSAVKAIQQPKK